MYIQSVIKINVSNYVLTIYANLYVMLLYNYFLDTDRLLIHEFSFTYM